MAKLENIFISGIRSYGIDKADAQTLTFYSPVTLFLGQNGCGKTTIIESVKHALTGEFPFSAKTGGQTFVADPHLYNVQAVKGCIKLKFRDIYGNPATIGRILKLEAQREKFKCTSQDAAYTYIDRDNIQRSLSVKLSDCKDMIKMLVGVSEAVLSNVLFCHQEDSMWPLSEDGAVKKKFDQIFDSSTYDQTVDVLSKNVKERANTLKNLNKELMFLQEMKTTALDKRNKLKDKKESLKLLNTESVDLKQRYAPLKKQLNDVIALEESLSKLQGLKSEKENQLASNREIQQSLKGILKAVFEGSDEQLEHEIANFHAVMKQEQDALDRVEAKMSNCQGQLKKNSHEVQEKRSGLASVNEQVNVYKARLKERDDNACMLLRELDSNSTPSESFDSNYAEIKVCLDNERKDLTSNEAELEKFEHSVQEEVDAAQTQLMEVKSRETLKKQEKQAALDEQHNIETQLADLSSSEVEFKVFEGKIQRCQNEIDSIQSSFNADTIEKTIFNNKKKIRELNEILEDYNNDMKLFTRNELVEKEIELCQSDKISKEKEIRNIRSKYHKQLTSLFEGIQMENIRSEVEKTRDKHVMLLQKQRRELADKEKASSNLNAKLSVQKNELENVKCELQNGRQAIEKICTADKFEEKLASVADENRRLQKEKGQVSAFKIIYKDFVKKLAEKKCCPVCETDFSTQQARLKQLANNMNETITHVPERLIDITTRLEKSEKLHNELTQLKPVYSKMTKLESDLHIKKNLVSTSEAQYADAKKVIDTLKSEIDKNQNILETCTQLGPGAAMIEQYTGDIMRDTTKMIAARAKLETISSKHSKAETETMIGETKEENAKLGDENERLGKKITINQKRLHDCRTQKADLAEAQTKLQRLVHDKPQLIVKQMELGKKIEELESVIEAVENDSLAALTDLEETKYKLNNIKRENLKTLNEIRKKIQKHESALNDIDKLIKEIKIIEKRNLEQKCAQINDQIAELNGKRDQIEQEWSKFNAQREKLKEDLHDQAGTDKSLQNNKKLRDLAKKEKILLQMISSVEADIGNKNYDNIDSEKLKLQREINAVCTELANIEGQVKSLDENIKELEKELTNCKSDPIKMYMDRMIEIKAEERAIEDLRRYIKHVSTAICKYHREQLLSLNLRLRDMWRSIYKGNDIDYIQIESGETELSATRRQYSYCLVQKKGDVLMPMRGKCSAGQKVLACLLVRIVLAEHFSADCGIFALDEPTTNLDRENIKSLSQAIARLINSHRAQRNFQFLIITHDEEFLDALREVDAVKEFYRVSRNYKGNTVVDMEEI